jgi:predicted Zn-dependent peptidase
MPIEFKRAALRNGLDVIAEVDPAAHTAAAGFYVRTGARDEDPAQMGVSHFLEHMVFKGSARRRAEDVDRDFDDLGADHNAYTTGEMTAFWAHSLPEHLPAAVEVLADIMRPALRQEDFDDEKDVVLEEIAMYDDQPFWVLYERTVERYFGGHPLGHRVLGTRQTVGGLQRGQMQAYAEERYAADNTTVALAGRVDFAALMDQLERRCGGWARSGAARRHDAVRPVEGCVEMTSATVNRHYSISLSPAPALQDERRYAAAILALVLGDAEGSRLYWALVETGLAEEARAQYDGHDRAGTFVVSYTCPPEDAAEVERVTAREIEALAGSLTADDLDRVRSKMATGATLQGELPAGRMHRLGRVWCSVREYRTLEEELRRINAVTLDDLRALCREFPFRPRVTGHLRPA